MPRLFAGILIAAQAALLGACVATAPPVALSPATPLPSAAVADRNSAITPAPTDAPDETMGTAAPTAQGCGPTEAPDWGPRTGDPPVVFGWNSPAVKTMGDEVEPGTSGQLVPGYRLPPAVSADLTPQLFLTRTLGTSTIAITFYAARAIGERETRDELFAERSFLLQQQPPRGADADYWSAALSESATVTTVAIGPHDAVLELGTTTPYGVRPSGLYWSDGQNDWLINGNIELVEAMAVARSLYCD